MPTSSAITGAILGCAIGDALGLPYENLSPKRGPRLLGPPDRYRFVFGKGLVSDDTEHTCMVAQALCKAPNSLQTFTRQLASRLRWWLTTIPAGIGFATLQSIGKLWLGFPHHRSGVFSAGNGPAMRSAILGSAIDDLTTLCQYVRASTRLTHTDPKAEDGAWAVALAAWMARQGPIEVSVYLDLLRRHLRPEATEFETLILRVTESVHYGHSTEDFARELCGTRGVSGYVYRTVPVVLHAWLTQPHDLIGAIQTIIRCGGDTDSTGAIVGSIIGAGIGGDAIPEKWLTNLAEWPQTVTWMRQLGERTAEAMTTQLPQPVPTTWWLFRLLRNLGFFVVVLVHLFRRALPPW